MIEQRLTDMLRNHLDALGSKQVFMGLLKDTFPQERIMVQLMAALHDMGIHTEIEKSARVTRDFSYRFSKRLTDERGIDSRHAENTTNLFCVCYAEALGKPCDALATPAPQANTASAANAANAANVPSNQNTAPVPRAGKGAPPATRTKQSAKSAQPVQAGQQAQTSPGSPSTLHVTLSHAPAQPAKQKSGFGKKWWHWVLIILALPVFLVILVVYGVVMADDGKGTRRRRRRGW